MYPIYKKKSNINNNIRCILNIDVLISEKLKPNLIRKSNIIFKNQTYTYERLGNLAQKSPK
jgi:hypothetical protein